MSSKAKELYEDYLFPGFKRTFKQVALHWEDYMNTPGHKIIAIILHALHFIIPWMLIHKYYHLIEPYLTNPDTKNYAWFTLVMTVSIVPFVLGNLFFSALYALKLPCVEKFKCNDAPWPWEENPEEHKRHFMR